jgi:putative ABC transport system permease protein
MRLGSLIHLYRVRLRSRLAQELLALAGIVTGVALIFSALVANTSLTGSVRQLTSGIVGATHYQLAARGPDGLDERLLAQVRRIDGVAAAAPILEARANVSGPAGTRSITLVGGDPRFARIGGPLLHTFTAEQLARQRSIALPAPLASDLGVSFFQPVRVETSAGVARIPLGIALQPTEIGSLVHSPVGIVPIALGQEITGMRGRISRIFVQPEPGRDDDVKRSLLQLAGDDLNVLPADNDVAIFKQAAYPTNQSTAMFSAFSALVGFLFAFSAVLLTVPQRRRFANDMKMAGYAPWAQVQVLAFDALVLGAVGALLGLGLGDVVSRQLFDSIPGYLAYAFPIGSQRVVAPSTIAIAGAAGVIAACLAVLAPLRDVLGSRWRTEPDEQSDGRRGRAATIVTGGACLAATVLVLIAFPGAALVGLGALTVALLLLLPLLVRWTTVAIAFATRALRTPVPTLAVLEIRSGASRMRTLALAATGAIAVFATVSIGGAHADLQRGLDAAVQDYDANADIWVTFPGTSSPFAVTAITVPPRAIAALRRIPDVETVGAYRGAFLDVGEHRAWVQAPPADARWPVPPTQLRAGSLRDATRRLRTGGWVVLSEAIADQLHARVGDAVTLPTPIPTRLRVAAISTNLGWPPGAVLLNADDYARAWGTTAATALQVTVARDADPATVARVVRRVLGRETADKVETQRERTERHRAASRDGLKRLTQITVLVLVSAMLAMAAAMGGMIWQRRPSIAGLKVHGFSEGELWRALLLESGLLLGAGCLVGALFGLLGQLLLSRALQDITGFPVVYSTAAPIAAGILALVTTVAVAMIALPGWLAVRVPASPSAAS